MASHSIELDSAGIREVLNSGTVGSAVHGLAARVAANTRGQIEPGADVVVDDYRTDRAASSVTIRDFRGRLWQARDGVLTRAASSAGLEVEAR